MNEKKETWIKLNELAEIIKDKFPIDNDEGHRDYHKDCNGCPFKAIEECWTYCNHPFKSGNGCPMKWRG